jgi:hypothetical protein
LPLERSTSSTMTSRTTAPTAATTIIGGIAGQHNSIDPGDGQVVFPGIVPRRLLTVNLSPRR